MLTVILGIALSMPRYLVWLVGIAFGAFTWPRRPTSSMASVAGFAVLLVIDLVARATMMVPMLAMTYGLSASSVSMVTAVLGLAIGLVRAVGIALALAGVVLGPRLEPEVTP